MESSMKPVWKCCLNCHFLTATAKGYKYSWDKQSRAEGQIADHYVASCRVGVWDIGAAQKLKAQLPKILRKYRGSSCFHIKHQPGMMFSAAEKLLELRAAQRSVLLSIIAVCISFLSLVAAFLV